LTVRKCPICVTRASESFDNVAGFQPNELYMFFRDEQMQTPSKDMLRRIVSGMFDGVVIQS